MTEFSAISFAALGGLYALLTVLLLTSWRGHRIGAILIVACIVSAGWSATLALQVSDAYVSVPLVFAIEVLRGGAWISFLVVLVTQIGVGKGIRYLSMAVWIAVLLAGTYVLVIEPVYLVSEKISGVMIPGGLVIALTGLMLIEQLYRNSPHDARWGIKALVLGVGGIFAYDLFLYSQAMLFAGVDSDIWMARGVVNILFVPLIAIAARRNPNWDLDIFVSRQVVFYSTTLVAVGVYLLLVSLGGYALVLYGGSWGALAQIVFFVGALLVLVFLLFSSTLRARVKVFLSKHFFRNKYDHREEWLRLVSTLSEFEDSSTREIVIKAMAQIVRSPSGVLWILDEGDKQYRVAAHFATDVALPDLGPDEPFIEFMQRESWLIDLDEYNAEPDRYGDLELPQWLLDDDDAWLLVPLSIRQHLVGLILVNHPPARTKLNYEDRDLLKTVGSHIAVHLAQEKSDSQLTEARQFEAYNRLTAFLMHDLNNLIAQQSLIVKNAEKHKRNPEFVDDAMQTVANSVERMKRVMEQLRRRDSERKGSTEDVRHVLQAAVDRCGDGRPKPELQLQIDDVPCKLDVDRDRFVMILVHLIKNAQDATPDDGTVELTVSRSDSRVKIAIDDSGSGMTPEFTRERLFRPFDTTKGSQGMGIAAYQAREYVRSLGGELVVESEPSKGTTVSMKLPAEFKK